MQIFLSCRSHQVFVLSMVSGRGSDHTIQPSIKWGALSYRATQQFPATMKQRDSESGCTCKSILFHALSSNIAFFHHAACQRTVAIVGSWFPGTNDKGIEVTLGQILTNAQCNSTCSNSAIVHAAIVYALYTHGCANHVQKSSDKRTDQTIYAMYSSTLR